MVNHGLYIVPGRQEVKSGSALYASILQSFYGDLLDQGVPDSMAMLVKRLDEGSAGPPLDGRTLALVVESDQDSRSLAAVLLEETGLAVVECTSAEAAVGVLEWRADQVAFIFADECLAGVASGADLARTAGQRWPHIHTVITTVGDGSADKDLPPGAVVIQRPWRGLDVLIQAERAIAAAA